MKRRSVAVQRPGNVPLDIRIINDRLNTLPPSAPRKIHLGCGPRSITGFIHIDLMPFPHIDYAADVRDLSFVPDNSVDLIYASHVLEHFGRWEYLDVLRAWTRAIKPGGVLRLAVPDFKACAAVYYERGLEHGISGLLGLICGGQRDPLDYHKMVFDEDLLRADLTALGYSDIGLWDWRTVEHSGVDDFSQAYIPHLQKDSGRHMSLNIQGVKKG